MGMGIHEFVLPVFPKAFLFLFRIDLKSLLGLSIHRSLDTTDKASLVQRERHNHTFYDCNKCSRPNHKP